MVIPFSHFHCLGYTTKGEGEVERYVIQVTDERSKVVVSVTPIGIASHLTMKRIFLSKSVVYMATKKEHDQWLSIAFFSKIECSFTVASVLMK